VRHMHAHTVNAFKARLWERFGLDSRSHEHVWGYEEWLRLGEPAIAVLRAIGCLDGPDPCVVLAHEFMGMPTALAAALHEPKRTRTAFYAHEVAPVRKIVEEHPGHDAMFYNVLTRALARGHYIEDLFGPQDGYFKYPLVKAARHCDAVFAVGDFIRDEMRFLGPEFADANIELTYNGIPAPQISVERNHASKLLLQRYAETLLGYRPDYVFTRVSRMSRSKGMWRDILVLDELERRFRESGRTAVMFFLSCEVPRRPNEDCWAMEREYGWPLAHREGGRDLSGGEAEFYVGVQAFNARSRNIKIIYVNQFGWSRETCGANMSEEMEFWDIRRGSDVEFGQSVYEPFGIAQLEALSFGSICVFSNVCGSAGFVRRVLGSRQVPNVIIADYTRMANNKSDTEVLNMPPEQRRIIERAVVADVARQIIEDLPQSPADEDRLLRTGHALAQQMSWEAVVRDYVLPAIGRIVSPRSISTRAGTGRSTTSYAMASA